MKKIIGILGVVVLAVTMLFNTNSVKEDNINNTYSLFELQKAVAMQGEDGENYVEEEVIGECFNPETGEVNGTYVYCISGSSICIPQDCI